MREVMKNPPSEEIIKYIFGPMLVTDKEKYFSFNNYINKRWYNDAAVKNSRG